MKQVLNFLLVFLVTISKAQVPNEFATYQLKEVSIPTRWAKVVSPANVLKEYPRPQLKRGNWINLNGLWDYAITDSTSEKVSKYDGRILVPYPLESALSGVKKLLQPDQLLWYRTTFDEPALKTGEKLLLNFGAVSWKATVYINDREAGKHTGAYTAFTLDITGLLRTGENEIKVKVSNPLENGIGPRGKQTLEPNSMWYTASSGVWQTVWLESVPENFIRSIKVTPDVDKGQLALSVASDISPERREEYSAEAIVYDGHKQVSRSTLPLEGVINVPGAKLWSPDSPFLYDLIIKLKKNGKVVDEVKSYFGMRKVVIKKDDKGMDRIFLNNKYTYNLGVLDQGFWPDGLYTAPTDEALKFDIEAAKAMGFNTIRKHIKVEPARWYYHADRVGVLVWQDLVQPGGKFGPPNSQVKAQFEKESAEILQQFHNYPAITTWILFNEGWGEYDQERLTNWVKQTDPTRLINGHSGAVIVNGKLDKSFIAQVVEKSAGSNMTDIHSYPPPAISNHITGKAMVVGEFGGTGVQVDGHLWDDLQGVFSYGSDVGGGKLVRIYAKMVDSLIKFEKQGLSASIYTQLYDVEGEQNGLMTYDREKTKMPFDIIRHINGKLRKFKIIPHVKIGQADTAAFDFGKQMKLFKGGKRDSAFLRKLSIKAWAKKDANAMKILSDAYVGQLKSPFIEVNLRYMRRFLRNTTDSSFPIFYNNIKKLNEMLGKDQAEGAITAAIERTDIKPFLTTDAPDWNAIEKRVVSKYGEIGKEIVWQSKVLHSANNKKIGEFEDNLIPWFKKYGHKRKWVSAGLINTLAWTAFENCTDLRILEFVIEMTTRGLRSAPDDEHLIDTHANLLYKLGRKNEAIEWEQKAIILMPNRIEYKQTLEKMKNNIPTWPNLEEIK